MALSKKWIATKDARIAKSGSYEAGAGASSYLPVGLWSGYLYRSLIGFSENWTDVSQIVGAKLRIRTGTQYYVGFGSDPDIYIERITSSWHEGSSVGLSSSNAVTWANQPSVSTTNRVAKDITRSEGVWVEINIDALIEDIAPATVKKRDGSPGGDLAFYGFRLRAIDEGSSGDTTEFYSADTSSDPEIILTYLNNQPPNAPALSGPSGIVATTTPSMVFVHSDPDADPPTAYDLQVSTDSTFASVTHWDISAQTSGISGNTITRTYGGTALTRGTTYYWRARTRDAASGYGAWSAALSFRPNRLPTATKTSPLANNLAVIWNLSVATSWTAAGTDAKPRFAWTYADADGDAQGSYRVRIYDAASGGNLLHDSGSVSGSAATYSANYGIKNGDQTTSTYWWTIEVTDSRGESSGESSRTAFKVLWGQAIYEYAVEGGANSSSWAFTSGSVAANTGKAFLFRNATGPGGTGAGAWQTNIGSVTPADYVNVLVRLASYASGTNPALPDMKFSYVGSAVFPDRWTTQNLVSSDWRLDQDNRRFGSRSLRCAVSTTSGNRFIYPETDVSVSANTEYTMSAFVKTAEPLASGAYLRVAVHVAGSTSGVYHAQGTVADGGATTDTASYPEGWQRLTVRFTTPVGVTLIRPMVHYAHNGTTSGDVFWVDGVKIEEGNVATAWAPGAIGSSIVDSGGVAIDGSRGGIFRLRGVTGHARDLVELGDDGLVFGGDVEVSSPSPALLEIGGSLRVDSSLYLGSDTNLYRSAADTIRTDDAFEVAAGRLAVDTNGAITTYNNGLFLTYTPTVTNSGTATWTTRTGWYVKIGKLVFVNIYLVVNAAGSGSTALSVSLPSTPDRTARQVIAAHTTGLSAQNGSVSAVILSADTGADIDRLRGPQGTDITGAMLSAAAAIVVQGWYREA